LVILATFAACNTDELKELNIDPQSLNEVNMNFFFTAAELSSASGGFSGDNRYIDWRTNIGYTSYFIQQLATLEQGLNGAGDKYFDNDEAWNAPWEFWYGNVGKTLAEIFRQTGEGGFEDGLRPNTRAASKVLWVLNFHRLTDFYGNIPYFESLRALEGEFTPAYDDQQTIYMDLFDKLTEAGQELSTSNPDNGFAAADIIFNGDISKWKKWNYSLMLRLAMRISEVDPSNAANYVNAAIAGGLMESNDDNVWIPMANEPGEWVNQNGISRAFQPGDGGNNRVMSKTFVDFLLQDPGDVSDDDPRLFVISEGVNGNTDPLIQQGMPNGLDGPALDDYTGVENTIPNETFTQLKLDLLEDADPYMIMNYAEVEFLLAEAKERGIGNVPGTAKEHYENGVRAAMQMYTPLDEDAVVTDAQVDAYLAAHPYTEGGADALEMIGNQMWASKFLNWWEAWSDWRRTGYPVLEAVSFQGSPTPGYIPTKLRIPNRELATNSENYQVGRTTPDDATGKVWWDVD
jgi:hypothetical protein